MNNTKNIKFKREFPWGKVIPIVLIFILSIPIILGVYWLVLSTFTQRTHGIIPVDANGNFGGLTLSNWVFLKDSVLWKTTLNTFVLASSLTIGVIIISSMAGYALSRIKFPAYSKHFFLPAFLLLSFI